MALSRLFCAFCRFSPPLSHRPPQWRAVGRPHSVRPHAIIACARAARWRAVKGWLTKLADGFQKMAGWGGKLWRRHDFLTGSGFLWRMRRAGRFLRVLFLFGIKTAPSLRRVVRTEGRGRGKGWGGGYPPKLSYRMFSGSTPRLSSMETTALDMGPGPHI